ncbi:unnamed protein product [Cylindrotheca closterium]|uniref:Uncharacterized protein n=1 Tax=Cylindrotheca closterium TaxID=2856 RepID=A0AAD2G288_9STRA|nr:unnamed protein product [Cylindrotheca closterium]
MYEQDHDTSRGNDEIDDQLTKLIDELQQMKNSKDEIQRVLESDNEDENKSEGERQDSDKESIPSSHGHDSDDEDNDKGGDDTPTLQATQTRSP